MNQLHTKVPWYLFPDTGRDRSKQARGHALRPYGDQPHREEYPSHQPDDGQHSEKPENQGTQAFHTRLEAVRQRLCAGARRHKLENGAGTHGEIKKRQTSPGTHVAKGRLGDYGRCNRPRHVQYVRIGNAPERGRTVLFNAIDTMQYLTAKKDNEGGFG